ncbi:MAG: ABC transporter substrate-binding protein [Leptolyngbyaceae cyanobacterium]
MAVWRRIMGWWGLILFTAAMTVSCGLVTPQPTTILAPAVATDCRQVSHDWGETEICGQPQKIAVFGFHNLGLLLSLGVQPAGFAMDADLLGEEVFEDPVRQIPYLGDRLTTQPLNLGGSGRPSLEKLTIMAPDLILGHGGNAQSYDLLTQIAPTLLVSSPGFKDQWQDNLRAIAQVLGKEDQAEALIAAQAAKVVETRAALADAVKAHPKLLMIGSTSLEDRMFTIGPDSYLGKLVESVGFELVSPPTPFSTVGSPVSLEILPELDEADSIILLGYNRDVKALTEASQDDFADQSPADWLENHQIQPIQASWRESAIAQTLTANKENRVYFVTYARWGLLNNPIGAELVLSQLQQFFLEAS